MFRWDATGVVSRIALPILVIGGKHDIVTQPAASQKIASEAQGATLHIVEEVNHMGFVVKAGDYNGIIRDFALRLQGNRAEALTSHATVAT